MPGKIGVSAALAPTQATTGLTVTLSAPADTPNAVVPPPGKIFAKAPALPALPSHATKARLACPLVLTGGTKRTQSAAGNSSACVRVTCPIEIHVVPLVEYC